MIEFNDIDFSRPNCPEPMHHHHPKPEPWKPCPPPFDPELKRVFDLAAHADHVAHKALDVASYANLDATAAKKLTEQTLAVLNKVSKVANEANLKSDQALTKIELLKDQATSILAELNKTQKGAGLAEDGSYIKDDSTNYITDATSLADADKKLDAQLKEVDNTVSSLSSDLDSLEGEIASLSERLGSTEALSQTITTAVGLNADGTYTRINNRITQPANNLRGATEKLAEAVATLDDTVNSFDIAGLQGQVSQNASDIVSLKSKDRELQEDLDNIILQKVNPLTYNLLVNGDNRGTIVIPVDKYLAQVDYDSNTKELVFTIDENNILRVPVRDLVDTYETGNGITINGNQIAIKIDSNSEKGNNGVGFLTSTIDGLKVDGIVEEINEAYVAGVGLDRTGNLHNDDHIVFYVKIQENTLPYLKAEPDGLKLDIDALRAEIGGGDQLDCAGIVDCIINSDTFNTWLTNKINQAVEAAMLWQIKEDNDRYIEPKNGKYVHVTGEIEATGAIYSGQD